MTASASGDVSFASAAALSNDDAALIEWLRQRDVECPLCQYNLCGLTVPRCPECGHALRLSVALIDPYIRAWLTMAVAVCGSAGLGLLLLCIAVRAGMPHEGLVDWLLIFFMATIPLPLVLLKTRRRFQRLPRQQQWLIALIVSIIPAAAMGVLCLWLR